MNIVSGLPIQTNKLPVQKNDQGQDLATGNGKRTNESNFEDVLKNKESRNEQNRSENNKDKVSLSSDRRESQAAKSESRDVPSERESIEAQSKLNRQPSDDQNEAKQVNRQQETSYASEAKSERTSQDRQVEDGSNQELSRQESLKQLVKLKNQGIERTDNLTRRGALQSFMLKMNSELKVQPEELVMAFSKLSLEELAMPPEDTIESVIGQLDLSIAEKEVARDHFHKMLQQTASTSLAEYLQDSGSEVSIELLSKDQLNKNLMNKNVDQISNQFFVDPNSRELNLENQQANELKAAGFGAAQAASQGNDQNLFFATQGTPSGATSGYAKQLGDPVSRASLESQLGTQSVQPANPDGSIELNGDLDLVSEDVQSLSDIDVPKHTMATKSNISKAPSPFEGVFQNSQANEEIADVQSDEMLSEFADDQILDFEAPEGGLNLASFDNGLKLQNSEGQAASQLSSSAADDATMAAMIAGGEQSDMDDGGEFNQESYSEVLVKPNSNNIQNNKGDFIINPRPATSNAEESANVREVVNQARYMIKNGGGEMKVKLAPEGLGYVDMKVNVKNGTVNVEMLADTNDAKRIIERGLGELKSTLASHKLNVDSIKVDTNNDTLTDLNQRNDDADRQFAQKFMQDFRNGNRQWQNGFLGLTGARAYQSQTEDSAQNPLLDVNNQKRKNAQRRLDLVA